MSRRLLALRASLVRGTRERVQREQGFTLIEAVMAMVLFLIVATALAGVLTSAIASNSIARERTIAQQKSQEKLESIRQLPYDQVGLPAGNPSGSVSSPDTITFQGLKATITTQIQWVDDPTPTSYATSANYKRVTVTVTRNKDSKILSRSVTYVAPPGRAPFGGINNAIVNVTVQDLGLNQPADNATVSLTGGPSAPLSDISGATGLVTFPALTPSPPTYSIAVTKPGGYVTLSDDAPGTAAATADLAPTQTFDTVIRIFKPAQINVLLQNPDSTPYTGATTLKVYSAFRNAWSTFSIVPADGGSKQITTLGGEPVIPGQQYTLRAYTPTGLCAQGNPEYVPAPGDYPTIVQRTFALVMTPCPSGNLNVTVNQLGGPAANAQVTVTGGPNDWNQSLTTNALGLAVFSNLPSGAQTYTVTATRCSQNAVTTATISTGSTTNVTLTLPNPPTATVVATARWAGIGAASANIGLSGGPCSITIAPAAADSAGQVTFVNVPTGSGYTATATKNTGSGSQGFSVAGGPPTNVTVNVLPTKVLTFTIQRNASTAAGANLPVTIGLTGGPNGTAGANPVYQVSATTNGSSQIQLTVPAATGYTYTIKAYMTGCPTTPAPSPSYRSRSGITVSANAGTTTMTINLTSSTCPLTFP